jgi:heptosyltransferase II
MKSKIRIQRFVDKYAGNVMVAILSLFRVFDKKTAEKQKFLVIKLWAIGDSILSLSLIRGIRESFPGCTVEVLIRSRVKDVFECYPVDGILNIDSVKDNLRLLRKFRQYDMVFDCEPFFNLSALLSFYLGKERAGFSSQFRSRLYTQTTPFRNDQHMVRNYLDMLGQADNQYVVEKLESLSVTEEERNHVDSFLSSALQDKKIAGITLGVADSSKNRMWFEERFAELADRILDHPGYGVVFIDRALNHETVELVISMMKRKPVNTMGIFTLRESFYLISRCSVYISNDTGPMHIAAAQGCRTIGLFGPNIPALWGPFGKGNIAIYKTSLPPAIRNNEGIFGEGNREGYMGNISVDDVFDAVKECME